jgi:hypothetical protein
MVNERVTVSSGQQKLSQRLTEAICWPSCRGIALRQIGRADAMKAN